MDQGRDEGIFCDLLPFFDELAGLYTNSFSILLEIALIGQGAPGLLPTVGPKAPELSLQDGRACCPSRVCPQKHAFVTSAGLIPCALISHCQQKSKVMPAPTPVCDQHAA